MNQDLVNIFQHEFNKLLSPIEIEIIEDWKIEGFDEDTIREALKEAVFNGAVSFRYIDKILQSWKSSKESVDSTTEQDLSWLE